MAIRTVVGAIRAGARELFGRMVEAGQRGAVAINQFVRRFPDIGRENARELYARLRGEVTTARNLMTAAGNARLPAANIPTNSRQLKAYRAQVAVTLADPASGYQRTLTIRLGFDRNPTVNEIREAAYEVAAHAIEHGNSPGKPEEGTEFTVGRMQLVSLTRRR